MSEDQYWQQHRCSSANQCHCPTIMQILTCRPSGSREYTQQLVLKKRSSRGHPLERSSALGVKATTALQGHTHTHTHARTRAHPHPHPHPHPHTGL